MLVRTPKDSWITLPHWWKSTWIGSRTINGPYTSSKTLWIWAWVKMRFGRKAVRHPLCKSRRKKASPQLSTHLISFQRQILVPLHNWWIRLATTTRKVRSTSPKQIKVRTRIESTDSPNHSSTGLWLQLAGTNKIEVSVSTHQTQNHIMRCLLCNRKELEVNLH